MRRISDLPDAEAAAELAACCASARWVERMLSQRPFKDATEVFESAERIWRDLTPADWLEAFRAHSMETASDAELKLAAEEQIKITRLRIEKLLTV